MQENRNTRINRQTTVRKKSNTAVVSAKTSHPVAKRSKNAVAVKRASNMHAVRTARVVNIKKEDKAPFPWSVVVVAVIMTALFLFMMMNYAEVDKYRSEINELDSKITTMKNTQANLQVELSNKYNRAEIEAYAREELGMVESEKLTNVHYITTEQEDKTEMHTYDEGEEGGFGFLLTGLGEVIRDFIK